MPFKKLKQYYAVYGVILFLIGGIGLYLYVLKPLQEAREHVPEVSYSIKVLVVGELSFMAGLCMALLSLFVAEERLTQLHQKIKTKRWIIILAAVIPIAASYFWFKKEMSGMGYHITF